MAMLWIAALRIAAGVDDTAHLWSWPMSYRGRAKA